MDPGRRRRVRLVTLLSAAVLLAGALVYTTFAGASPAERPSQLLRGTRPGQSYELTGTVVKGSLRRERDRLEFRVRDRGGGRASVPVSYSGAVPEPFREGREIIVTVRPHGGTFVGERDSLITKCPSKFTATKGS
jgi:cytochrome c-type biogenesis protein CcmE